MKKILHVILISLFSLTIISCAKKSNTSSSSSSEGSAVTTLAGTGSIGSANGTGTLASFSRFQGITRDGTNLYVADTYNHLIRKIVISTGVVTTLAGTGSSGSADNSTGTSASFNGPMGITTDGTNLYVADFSNHLIRKIVISTGVVTTVAGTGSSGSANGTGTSASFNYPFGITTDGTNLYVTDNWNHLIRKIVISTGVVTTLAGTGSSGSANGTGTSASFNGPAGITTDGTNLYVAEYSNNLIRQIVISTGVVTTLAGTGSSGSADNSTGTSASFGSPAGITTDGTNLYVADHTSNLIRKIVISTGAVTTLAGTGSSGSADNSTGTLASFYAPYGITTDGTNLYVTDSGNHLIRKIVISTGAVTTLAGTGSSGSANGTGTSAGFNTPIGITTDGTNLYVADSSNHLIRKIVISTGAVTTVAGTGGSSGSANGTGTSASFFNPRGITTDGTNLYVANSANHLIRQIE